MDNTKSGIGGDDEAICDGNRMDASSSFEKNARNNELAVVATGNRMDTELALGEDVRKNRLIIVDDRLATRDDRSAVGDDGLAAKIGKRTDIDDGSDA